MPSQTSIRIINISLGPGLVLMSLPTRISLRFIVTMVATMLLTGITLSSQASASCGDYLSPHNTKFPQGALLGRQAARDDSLPLPSPRCNGPHCSQAPASVPNPVPTMTIDGTDWALLVGMVSLDQELTHAWHQTDAVGKLLLFSAKIFRPPRQFRPA